MTIKTKYNRGDEVFIMRNERPTKMRVENINIVISYYGVNISYELTKFGAFGQKAEKCEGLVFSSKEELLKTL